jgi:hypothetical protein
LRTPNYRQQKKTREDARKLRKAQKQERRQTPAKEESGEVDEAQGAPVAPEIDAPQS